jgi:hypothetical protein
MLDDTENYIKDNLQNILDGKFDDKFDKEQLKMMLEMSFLYNHININTENNSVVFRYDDKRVSLEGLPSVSEIEIVSCIKSDAIFKSAFKQFLRDKKINDILE